MTRRELLASLLALAAAPISWRTLAAHAEEESMPTVGNDPNGPIERIDVPKQAWRDRVSPEAFAVLFEEDTEPPRSSPLEKEKRAGVFVCAACYLPLFDAATKFESGTGWPSFFDVLPGHVETRRDFKLLLPRTEYHCARCGGHQGHVFKDGPPPTGLRYCNNGVALRFVPEGEPLPALRSAP